MVASVVAVVEVAVPKGDNETTISRYIYIYIYICIYICMYVYTSLCHLISAVSQENPEPSPTGTRWAISACRGTPLHFTFYVI
jgi:hypothetical protein